ncbi:sigma-70 family RNA polymerase sigma factor [Paenibacillus motobuensis]|uniref:RNA polymerase sigma factor n=1 Tax=Paenibacillus TaxID=44249 RepID=UPI0020426832|nr:MULTISPECIES: sigma-70 family RNA polymerase sigma factor [Paenibacillus]MCM3042494.1 sigma-70 family RNA polymerase sigma factor [Paenibacillus lutimineralis]MCM3649598.1 sigma-70 family RNA polymerase sigma factor [Paenibacillus motobuensis]
MAVDGHEVERLIYAYGSRVYTFCRKLTFSQTDADDLYQQTFLRILNISLQIDENNNPAGYIMAVTARIWHDERKKYARRQRIAPIQDDHVGELSNISSSIFTDIEFEEKQRNAEVREAVQKLPEKLRVPILLYYMSDLPVHEIALALRIPQGTVKSRLHQARQKLRKELGGIHYGG